MSNQNIQQNACGIQFSTHVQTSRNTKKRISFESVVAYTTEIQRRILFDGISPPGHLPSQSGIKKSAFVKTVKWQKKKNSPVPTEPLSQANSEYTLRLFC